MPKHARARERGIRRPSPTVVGAVAVGAALAIGGFTGWRVVAASGPETTTAVGSVVRLDVAELASVPAAVGETLTSAAPDDTPPDTSAESTLIAAGIEERLAACAPYEASLADIIALPGQAEPFAFCLNPASEDAAPALADETIAALQAACAPLAQRGYQVGYLLLDRETGRGLAGNLDARVYGASSFKGPFALYLCESQLDAGRATLETWCSEFAAAPYMDSGGAYLSDGAAAYPLGELAEKSIVESGNDPYRILRANYDGDELRTWLAGLGIPADVGNEWYPAYTARESAQLWLHTAGYLNGDSASAAWLGSLLARCETSFIRDALAPWSVQGKAGWNADTDPAYCGICDAGLVTVDGRTYLLSVMSSAPYSTENVAAFKEVAAAVFAAREDLA